MLFSSSTISTVSGLVTITVFSFVVVTLFSTLSMLQTCFMQKNGVKKDDQYLEFEITDCTRSVIGETHYRENGVETRDNNDICDANSA